MKKVFAMMMTACMIVGLTACGGTKTEEPAASSEAPKVESEAASSEAPAESEADAAEIDFPTKDMTIVCPYSAGGGTDGALRILAQCAQDYYGVNVTVENKTGGSGTVGLSEVLAADPDGYTLGCASVDLITIPMLGLADNIKPDSFVPICLVNGEPASIIVKADSPYETFEDFVQAGIDNPGAVKIANAGSGNIWHLSAIGIEQATGASFTHVPYDGAATALAAVLGDAADAIVCSPAEAASNIEAGELKVLAVAGDERLEAYPDVPTYKESGVDLTIMAVRGLCVSAETPDDVVKALQDDYAEIVNSDSCKELVETAGMTYMPMNAEETTALLDSMSGAFQGIIEAYLSSAS